MPQDCILGRYVEAQGGPDRSAAPVGQVDDIYLIAIAIIRLLNRAEGKVVMEHWKGGVYIKSLVTNIARVAEFFLPKKIKNVLRGRIEPRWQHEAAGEAPLPRAVNE